MKNKRFIKTSKSVDDFLEKLPPKQFKQIFSKVWSLRENTRPNDSSKLAGYENLYRTDSGEYRIVYFFDESIVTVEVIGKRNDGEVYKKI